jgi:hypothetical protein
MYACDAHVPEPIMVANESPIPRSFSQTELQSFCMVLWEARSKWADCGQQLGVLKLNDHERKALIRVTRRQAVLAAAHDIGARNRTLRRSALWMGVRVYGTALVLPAVAVVVFGIPRSVHNIVFAYLGFVSAVLVVALASSLESTYWNARWYNYNRTARRLFDSALVTTVLGLIVAYFVYARLVRQPFHIGAVFGGIYICGMFSVEVIGDRIAWTKEHRKYSALPVCYTAALLLMDVLVQLTSWKREWRPLAIRRKLADEIALVAGSSAENLDRAARTIGGGLEFRKWALERGRDIEATLRIHQRHLLEAQHQDQFDEIVRRITEQAASLADGSWELIERVSGPALSPAFIRRLIRFAPAAILFVAAISVRLIPGLQSNSATLLTVELGLAVSAVLSLLPLAQPGQEMVLSSLRDAIGKLR